ncbi:4Fe-4S binding protein [Rhodovastum atsumiense]|uniref:4Fe-4S binding protein n=1 Tax=Rhodovastum atsumiense TaxID=504468 RepID=UPI001EF15189|nr:4Fe-4S binding protein [Rhodovastum atsumiense]CAH2601565.1 4Fe-4S binding protein [Rhodovastum atsumiense]
MVGPAAVLAETCPAHGSPCAPPGASPGRIARLAALLERFFVTHRRQLSWVHAGMFVVFLLVIGGPLLLPDPPGDATPWNNLRVGASYALWGLWFPLVFLSVIFAGRAWCGVLCPMGAAAEWANGVGLRRPIPAWLRWEGTPLVSFIVITLLGQTTGVRDHPEAAAEIFGGTMLMAIVIGFLYGRRKRAWCRHMCPIGRVLGLYARLGAVEFAPKTRLPGPEAYTEKGVCPTMIDLPHKAESRHCISCFRCVNPDARGGVSLRLRRPGEEIEAIRDHHPNPTEVWFLFLDTGVALGGFLWLVLPAYQDARQAFGEWAIEHGWAWITAIGPSWLMSVHPDRGETFMWLDFLMINGFMIGCMIALTVVLAATTAAAAVLARQVGARGSFAARFAELGYQYAPIALISLVIGLGAELFEPLRRTAFGIEGVHITKGILFLLGFAWSVWLADRVLVRQGVAAGRRWLPLLPGILGSLATGLAWWPAIFGL